jgi:hypothetical protein
MAASLGVSDEALSSWKGANLIGNKSWAEHEVVPKEEATEEV